MDALAELHVVALLVRERLLGMEVDAPGPAAVVVDWHPDVAAERVVAERRDQREPGEQPLRHAPIVGVRLAVAAAVERQPEIGLLDLENDVAVGLDVVVGLRALVHRVLVDLVAMHVGYVAGVDAAFHGLQVVGFLQPLGHEHVARRQAAPFDLRRRRLLVLRPHIGPDHAGPLDARIGLDAHQLAGLRRRRHVDAAAVAGEFEPVVGAADAVLLVAAEEQRSAAVRAELVDQPDLAVAVAEREQLLAHDLDAHLRVIGLRDLVGEENRHPVAAQQVSHRGAGTGAHQRFGHLLVHGCVLLGAPVARASLLETSRL